MPQFTNLTAEDIITDTTKVTTGYFTGGVGTLDGSNLATSSLSDGNKEYYYNLQYSSADQFSVTYGHPGGSGSADTVGQTKAIYNSFAAALLAPDDIEYGFIFTGSGTPAYTDRDSDVWFLVAERAQMKDRLNKKNWTITLSGSRASAGIFGAAWGTGSALKLTDDSNINSPTGTPVGPRYNIKSGSAGVLYGGTEYNSKTNTNYGHFYPNMGVIVLSGTELSSSLPGAPTYVNSASVDVTKGVGFAPDRDVTVGNADNALKMVQSLQFGSMTFRSEEDQTTVSHFCRAKVREYNFTSNPTFYTGSDGEFTNRDFEGNPQTFISTIGLYDSSDMLVAVGRLSTPVQKNYSSEAVIKVNITL
tara:strand:- start:656 stop:1738 length:1083 start_codon:yes stop_codon:yes gene_type:complete